MNILSISFDKSNRILTIILLAVAMITIVFPIVIGLADDIPGIALIFIGIVFLALAFFHHRLDSKKSILLILLSACGFIVFVVLHNLFDALEKNYSDTGILTDILNGVSVASFLLAVFVCPLGVLTGLIWTVVNFFKK